MVMGIVGMKGSKNGYNDERVDMKDGKRRIALRVGRKELKFKNNLGDVIR